MPLLLRVSQKKRWLVPLVFLGAFVVFAKVMNTNPPTNSARTSPDDAELPTTLYQTQPELAAPKVAKLRRSTYGRAWKFVAQHNVSPDEIQLVFHVPVVVFTDVLTVSLKRMDAQTTQVNIESHSQIGQGDFGENRRHIRQMIAVMNDYFAEIASPLS